MESARISTMITIQRSYIYICTLILYTQIISSSAPLQQSTQAETRKKSVCTTQLLSRKDYSQQHRHPKRTRSCKRRCHKTDNNRAYLHEYWQAYRWPDYEDYAIYDDVGFGGKFYI